MFFFELTLLYSLSEIRKVVINNHMRYNTAELNTEMSHHLTVTM